MPVYLFTYHAYRSWMPDNKRGYVRKRQGILPQNIKQAEQYNQRAKHPPVEFSEEEGWTILESFGELCSTNEWILYEAVVVPSHVHALVGWRDETDWRVIRTRLKQKAGSALSRRADKPGPWFSRGSSRKRVRDRKHFEYLLEQYLPSHGPIRWTRRAHTTDSAASADSHPQLSPNDPSQDEVRLHDR